VAYQYAIDVLSVERDKMVKALQEEMTPSIDVQYPTESYELKESIKELDAAIDLLENQ
jgi:hypothetical protein